MTLENEVLKKYLAPGETTWDQVVQRMARFADSNNIPPNGLLAGRIIPAGSILYGLNNPEYTGSFSNCYFIPIQKDSIEGIFTTLQQTARTFSKRGGVGTDISILRPEGSPVKNAAKTSTGAVSFMPLFSKVAETIGQNGRRGALIITMDCRHPDILKFILAKYRPQEVFATNKFTGELPSINSANVSIKFTDAFMRSVTDDEDWDLWFPDFEDNIDDYNNNWDGNFDAWKGKRKVYYTLKARDVYRSFATAQHACGDPGGMFMTTARRWAPASYVDERLVPMGSNP
jgi:ribonucleotide reductase alpha subunit